MSGNSAPNVAPAAARFRDDRAGTVAILFTVALLPIMLAIGGAVDYAAQIRARQTLDIAADASALAAAQKAAQRYRDGYSDWQSYGVSAGQKMFAASLPSSASNIAVGAPTVSVSLNGQSMSASVGYVGSVKTNVLHLANITTLPVVDTVRSSVVLAKYTDLHIVIDTSQSMGMAATLADQTAIQTALGTNCFVGCHINAFPGSDTTASYRAAGATLRIDVLKTAVTTSLTALQTNSAAGTLRVAIYTFDNVLKPVFALSSDLAAAKAAVSAIDLSTDGGGTNITYSLNALNGMLGSTGTGVNSASPKGAVLLFTDGVQDHEQFHAATGWANDPNWVAYTPSVYNQWDDQPIDPGACAPIKSKGYSFLVLNVNYMISASDLSLQTRYGDIQNVVLPALQPNIDACSSGPGYSYSANSPTEINTAVSAMFASAAGGNPRLTN